MRTRVVKPGLNFEYIMWFFTRFSGIALIILAVVGMVSAFAMSARTQMDLPTLFRWTFFPNPNHIRNSNVPTGAVAWVNGFWQVMQMLLVFFGVTHGFNGLRVVLEDYLAPTVLKPLLRGLVFSLWLFVLIISVFVILAS